MPVPWRLQKIGRDAHFPLHDIAPACPVADASDRAISLRQLRSLRDYIRRLCKTGILKRPSQQQPPGNFTTTNKDDERVFWFSINQYDINELVLKKIIPKNHSCSWVELIADPACPQQAPDTYLSHAWAESFRDFMLSIEHHAKENRVSPDHTYWFCVCANNQWDVSSELDTTLQASPFFRALQKAQTTLLLLDKQGVVMKRAWCLFEWYQTVIGLERPDALEVATGMGLVGCAMVSSGRYVDLLNSLCSKDAEASDPRDLRRIQNSIAGVEEMEDLDMIVRIESSSCEGRIVVPKGGLIHEDKVYEYQRGFGDPLRKISGGTIANGETFHVSASLKNPREYQLFACINRNKELEEEVLVQGGSGTNLIQVKYISQHQNWLRSNETRFHDLDKRVKVRALSSCRESFESKHKRGDISSPTFRAITLSELRQFAVKVKQRFQKDGWNPALFEGRKSKNRKRIAKLAERSPRFFFESGWDLEQDEETRNAIREEVGSSGPGEYYGNHESMWDGNWETLSWYHIKHLMLIDDVFIESATGCSYVEAMPKKKALRGQFHFTFGWDSCFADFMNGIEWLAEARELPDTTPMFVYPLTINVVSRREYYDGKVWESNMEVCDSSVMFGPPSYKQVDESGTRLSATALLDIHNAVNQRKSLDLMSATGLLALVRPFQAGKAWEIGRFDVDAALVCINLDAGEAFSHSGNFLRRLRSIGQNEIKQLLRKVRSAGAGPVLREAAYYDDTETVKLVFRQCPWLKISSERLRGPLGETPLHIAASAGSIHVLEFLLQNGANVDAMDSDGETPLHYAALAGKEASAKILLEASADAQQESFFSETPLEVVSQQPAFFQVEYGPIHKLLIAHEQEESTLSV